MAYHTRQDVALNNNENNIVTRTVTNIHMENGVQYGNVRYNGYTLDVIHTGNKWCDVTETTLVEAEKIYTTKSH